MEYIIPSLITACGFFFLMWQRSSHDRQRLERRTNAIAETRKLKRHTSTIMKKAIDLRDEKLLALDKVRQKRQRELQMATANIAKTTTGAEVAAAWNQEF